jgi:GT2 family glycosyltransferase
MVNFEPIPMSASQPIATYLPNPNLRIAVVIPLYQGEAVIEPCLASMAAQTLPPAQIIVVDDGSPDQSAELVKQQFPQVVLIQHLGNLGYGAAVNTGIRRALASEYAIDLVLLLNQDTVADAHCLQALSLAFQQDAGLGIAGCKLLYPDGKTIQHAGGYVAMPSAFARHFGQNQLDDGSWDEIRDVDFVTGAALAIRSSILKNVGGLDESFGRAYYEDIDLCFRVRAAGFAVRYLPHSRLIHHESTVLKGADYERAVHVHRARLCFALKHWPTAHYAQLLAEEREMAKHGSDVLDLLAHARAHLVCATLLENLCGSRSAIYGAMPNMQTDDRIWHGVQQQLLAARELALARAATVLASQNPSILHVESTTELSAVPLLQAAQELAHKNVFTNFEFISHVPVFGKLIAKLRAGWYNVAARWAVQHLAKQQSEFNASVQQVLSAIATHLQRQNQQLLAQQQHWHALLQLYLEAVRADNDLAAQIWPNVHQQNRHPTNHP